MATDNKYKGLFYITALVLVLVVGLYLKSRSTPIPTTPETPVTQELEKTTPAPTIGSEKIKEENFSGSKPTIPGSSALVLAARAWVDKSIAEFKAEADTDVPDMREKFGADSPTANYTIDISAKDIKGPKTESIILSQGTYTGGANGNTLYKVFTASLSSGKILSLQTIIKKDKQAAFTSYVKKALTAWRPEGSTESVVFEDDIKGLEFSTFANWSLDNKNLTIYFDKYQIGPGALGAVAFPLSLSKIKDFLEPTYQ